MPAADAIAVPSADTDAALPDMISAIGTHDFSSRILALLDLEVGAEHCAIFELSNGKPNELAAVSGDGSNAAHRQVALYLSNQHWRSDPTLPIAQAQLVTAPTVVVRLDISQLPGGFLRDVVYGRTGICDRVTIWGSRCGAIYGLNVLRSRRRGAFADVALDRLSGFGGSFISIIAKHREVQASFDRRGESLSSVSVVEEVVARATTHLPLREIQVCARILFGLTTAGIASDLGVGEESVITYKKRAFRRLEIATRHELLRWYLAQPGRLQTGPIGQQPS